jgi:hypothetical protein
MGTIQHDAIIATTFDEERFDLCVKWIKEFNIEEQDFYLIQNHEVTNGYRTIVVSPYGSKEGWEESNAGDYR